MKHDQGRTWGDKFSQDDIVTGAPLKKRLRIHLPNTVGDEHKSFALL